MSYESMLGATREGRTRGHGRSDVRVVLVGVLVGFLVGAAIPVAMASSAQSPYGYYTVYGIQYRNHATVVVNPSGSSGVLAYTGASAYPQQTVPAGYIGVLARLYRNDALVKQAGYFYNSEPLVGMSRSTSPNYTAKHGAFFSYGVSRAYNGSGYGSFYTFKSPSLNW